MRGEAGVVGPLCLVEKRSLLANKIDAFMCKGSLRVCRLAAEKLTDRRAFCTYYTQQGSKIPGHDGFVTKERWRGFAHTSVIRLWCDCWRSISLLQSYTLSIVGPVATGDGSRDGRHYPR